MSSNNKNASAHAAAAQLAKDTIAAIAAEKPKAAAKRSVKSKAVKEESAPPAAPVSKKGGKKSKAEKPAAVAAPAAEKPKKKSGAKKGVKAQNVISESVLKAFEKSQAVKNAPNSGHKRLRTKRLTDERWELIKLNCAAAVLQSMDRSMSYTLKAIADQQSQPRKSNSGYQLFSNSIREAIKKAHPDIKNTELFKENGRQWRALTPAERAQWLADAAALDAQAQAAAAQAAAAVSAESSTSVDQ